MKILNRHILYVSSIVPRQGSGGWIVIQRHLQRLESAGWKISLVVPQQCIQAAQIPSSWESITIPMRKWWWLPMKTYLPGSLELRLLYWQIECECLLKNRRPDTILTILGDNYALLASRLSQAWKIPLSTIIHDDLKLRSTSRKEQAKTEKYNATILKLSSRAWLVTPEMKDVFPLSKTNNTSVLLPVPEGNSGKFVNWKPEFMSNPVVAHAGSFYPFHVPYFRAIAEALKKLNGTLLIVTSRNNPALTALLEKCNNIQVQELFEKNQDVLDFLRERASCMVVAYPFGLEQHPWTATSFPSRMIEFMHLGLPFLILASPNTALANWAVRNNWHGYLSRLDEASLLNFLKRITDQASWSEMADQSRHVAINEFNPDLIQAQFESELEVLC